MPYLVFELAGHTTCSILTQIIPTGQRFNCNTRAVYSALSLPVHDVD